MSNQVKGRPGGVLPINAAAMKKVNTSTKSSQRSPAPKLRLIIRRLPPGLVEAEFWEVVGTEWQAGNGKVDWQAFKEGKVSKDPSKPSRPGRAYIKVKDQSLLEALSAKVRASSFKDAKNTGGDPCLVGPPSLEFAPYNKTPGGRNRHDGRQGTIDQDQEFIDFLQSLTEPITKPTANGSEVSEIKQDKVSITPLVQFIKEKKANKAKEKEAAAAAKSSKKNQEAKEGKSKGESRPTIVVKSNASAADKARVAKATQEAVKVANKSASQIQNKTSISKSEQKAAKEVPVPVSSPSPAANTPPPKPERQRGNASAASRLIARDLGLTPKEPRTPRAARNVSAATTPATEATKPETQPKRGTSAAEVSAKTNAAPATNAAAPAAPTPTGPRNNRPNQLSQAKSTATANQRPVKAPAQPSEGAKSAFLKHANPSQGVTEELLRTVFSTFGEITSCEIDKKKGLGYIDFIESEALKKAMAASPVKVGNGQVVVLQNRSPYKKAQNQSTDTTQQQSATGTPSSRGHSAPSSNIGSAITSPQPTPAAIAPTEPAIVATTVPAASTATEKKLGAEVAKPLTTSVEASVTPTAPKGGKGGNAAARGGRANGGPTAGRGNFNQGSNRGRGGFRGRGSRGGRPAADVSGGTGPTPAATVSIPSGSQEGSSEATKTAPSDKA